MKVLTAILIVLSFAACQSEEKDPCTKFDEVDREMLSLINQIRTKHADNKKFLSNFNMEQVYWINYRDHHLKSVYPEDWSRYYRKEFGKEVFNPCKCKEMTRFTYQRIDELKLWLTNGPSGQEECPSLWSK